MNSQLENYYATKPEPYQGALLALRYFILSLDAEIMHERKFQIPFFTYKGYKLGYLWLNGRKLKLGFCIDRNLLPLKNGVKQKDKYESIVVDPKVDLPVALITKKIKGTLIKIDKKLKSSIL